MAPPQASRSIRRSVAIARPPKGRLSSAARRPRRREGAEAVERYSCGGLGMECRESHQKILRLEAKQPIVRHRHDEVDRIVRRRRRGEFIAAQREQSRDASAGRLVNLLPAPKRIANARALEVK